MKEKGREHDDDRFLDDWEEFNADVAFHTRKKAEKEQPKATPNMPVHMVSRADAPAPVPIVHHVEMQPDENERRERAAEQKRDLEQRRGRMDRKLLRERYRQELPEAVAEAVRRAEELAEKTKQIQDNLQKP